MRQPLRNLQKNWRRADQILIKKSVSLTFLSLLTSLASFFSQIVIAKSFGTSASVDQYLVASSIPLMTSGVIASMFSFSLVPALIAHRDDSAKFAGFAFNLFKKLISFSIAFVLIGIAYSKFSYIESNNHGNLSRTTYVALTIASWAWAGVLILVSYLGCVLTAAKSFYPPVFAQTFPYLGVIIILGFKSDVLGVLAIPLGILSGSVAAVIYLYVNARQHMHHQGLILSADNSIRKFIVSVPWVMLSMLCFTSYPVTDAFWAPTVGAGVLASLGYAQRLLIAGGNLIVVAPSALLASSMADANESGNGQVARSTLTNAVSILIILCGLICACAFTLAVPFISIIFKRGTFDARSCLQVAAQFKILLAGLIPMLASTLIFRGMFQLRAEKIAGVLGGIWAVLYFVSSGILSAGIGEIGIAVAYSTTWWLVFCAGYFWLIRPLPLNKRASALKVLAIVIAAVGVTTMVNAKYMLRETLNVQSYNAIFKLFTDTTIVAIEYVAVIYFLSVVLKLKVEELISVQRI